MYALICYIFVLLLPFIIFASIWYYKYVSKYSDFPSISFTFKLLRWLLIEKIPKDVSFTQHLLLSCIDICKQFYSEGQCLFWFFRPYILVYNEELIKVFCSERSSLDKPFMEIFIFKELLGTGLLTSDGALWRKRRKMFNPVFHQFELKESVSILNKNSAMLVKKLKMVSNESSIDILKFLHPCTLLNNFEFLTGREVNDSERVLAERLIACVTDCTKMATYRLLRLWLWPRFTLYFFSEGRKCLKMVEEMKQIAEKLLLNIKESVQEKEDNKTTSKIPRQTVVKTLFECNQKDPEFTASDMQDEFITFLIAGYDTVAYGLLWCLFLLGHDPNVQEKVYKELDSFMKTELSWEDLHNLRYLECVIKESLRLYPPVPVYARYVEKDIKCGKYTYPKGTDVILLPLLSRENPKVFPKPQKFDPGRFFEANSDKEISTHNFAEGKRSCIGKPLALIGIKVVLAHIIKNFIVTSLNPREDVKISWEITLRPSESLYMRLTPRESLSL